MTAEAKKTDDRSGEARLSHFERLGYGLGDFSGNLIYSSISSFLIAYLTGAAMLDAATVSAIIAVSQVFDGVSDVAMGFIIERTRSKYGKARIWLPRLCLPLAVSFVMLFSVPASLGDTGRAFYAFIAYNLVTTVFYTGINVPYSAMNGLMTEDGYERGLLSGIRMLLATLGTMTVNTFMLKMTNLFGGGDQGKGWTAAAAVFAAVFAVGNTATFLMCKERVGLQKSGEKGEKIPLAAHIKALLSGKNYILTVMCIFVVYFMMSCFFSSALFYAQFNLGSSERFSSISNALSTAQIAAILCCAPLIKRFGKKPIFISGALISAIGFIGTYFAGKSIPAVIMLSAVKGVGFGFAAATMFGLLQDAISRCERKSGFYSMGVGNAASSLCMKLGSGAGTAALGALLDSGGFERSASSQPPSALGAISSAFIFVPAASMLLAAAAMAFYSDSDRKSSKGKNRRG